MDTDRHRRRPGTQSIQVLRQQSIPGTADQPPRRAARALRRTAETMRRKVLQDLRRCRTGFAIAATVLGQFWIFSEAPAQTYPNRPVVLVVGSAASTGTDVI